MGIEEMEALSKRMADFTAEGVRGSLALMDALTAATLEHLRLSREVTGIRPDLG